MSSAQQPQIHVTLHADGTGEIRVDDDARPIADTDLTAARRTAVRAIVDVARETGQPVRAVTSDPDGHWPILVHPDGRVDAEQSMTAPGPPNTPISAPIPIRQAPTSGSTATTRRELRASFLAHAAPEQPATQGWRAVAGRLGIKVGPSAAERAERADLDAVSQHWPGPRTIAIVNGKGGASKTTTTIGLAAIFARNGGAGVLAWDNNQTRGTLGWRTDQGPHDSTLLELLPQADKLLGPAAQASDLARYVHHQPRDRFDVLRSKPSVLADEQRVTGADVDAIHTVATKYYRLVLIDSGNDETDPLWLRMIDHADQLVIATTTRDDHAETGALLLEALADRDERSAQLAHNAVAIISQADPSATAADLRHITDGYRQLVRETVTIPHDPAMVDGLLHHDALRRATRRAWLAAGAAVARGL